MRALDLVDSVIDSCWGPPVDSPSKRRREPSSVSAEEGYESVSDEDATAAAPVSATTESATGAADDRDVPLFTTRKLSAGGAESEDSGLSRDGRDADGPASLASSAGSTCGAQVAPVTTSGPKPDEDKEASTSNEQPAGSTSPAMAPAVIVGVATHVPVSSGTPPAQTQTGWDRAVEAKEHAFARLEEELKSAHQELLLRDEEVARLSRIRDQVEAELEELTASLFQEAHNMVREANERQTAAERALNESTMQVDVLSAEVAALKTLVLTSTPSRPNARLHPQIDQSSGSGLFRKHRRSPSHFNLKYGRENSPPGSPTKEPLEPSQSLNYPADRVDSMDGQEVDPNVHADFLQWRQHPTLDRSDPFVARVYREDIVLCLEFNNSELAERVRLAVENGSIFIEGVGDRTKTSFPKRCALLDAPRQCHYRMKLGDQETWHSISQLCRNRITAVIDFLNYLRYIERGLVKSSVHDIYWEIVRLRKEMSLARLGLPLSGSK